MEVFTPASPRRRPSPRGGGPIPIAAAAAVAAANPIATAAAAAAAGLGVGWLANRRSDQEENERRAGAEALQREQAIADNMSQYGEIHQDTQNLEKSIQQEKQHVQDLTRVRDRYKRAMRLLEDKRNQYHRVPHPLRAKAEILIPKRSLMNLLREVQYTTLIRRIRNLGGGGGDTFARFDDAAIQFLRKHHKEPLSYLETHFDPALHPQLQGRLRQIERSIHSASVGEGFHVDGKRFSSVQDMNTQLQRVRQLQQTRKTELKATQVKITQLNAENQQLELELGRACNTLFRKWLKAPGETGNGVPVRVVQN